MSARLLAAAGPGLGDHLAAHGPVPRVDADRLIALAADAGLTGRGGAAYPTHRKLDAVRRAASRSGAPIIVGNGSEGEPLSAKDRTLLAAAPHLVIDGLLLCADALGAREVRLVAPAAAIPALERARAERPDSAGLRISEAGPAFVSGEASAVVGLLAGRAAIPRDHAVRLAERGLRRAPTLVQNVETLAQLAVLVRLGADGFRAVGSPDDPGTRLASVSGPGVAPRVFEVPGGMSIRRLLEAAGVPIGGPVLVGGYHGAWLPADAHGARLSPAGLEPRGAQPGAGIVHALAPGACGLRTTADILGLLAAASAGQCGPCVNGLPRIAQLATALADGRDTVDELHRVAGLVDGRGACHHPDGSVRLLRSALRVFAEDVAAHARGGCVAREAVAA